MASRTPSCRAASRVITSSIQSASRNSSTTSSIWRRIHTRNSQMTCSPLTTRARPSSTSHTITPQRFSPPSTRSFTASSIQRHGDITPPKPGEERKVTFIDKEGRENVFEVADGDNLLDIAQANDLEMEGACGGSCACSTCHVIVAEEDMFDKMVCCALCDLEDDRPGHVRPWNRSLIFVCRKSPQTTRTTCWTWHLDLQKRADWDVRSS